MAERNKPRRLTQKQINQIIQELEVIKRHYKEKYSTITIDKGYEKNRKAIKQALLNLKQLVEEASKEMRYEGSKRTGRAKKLTIEQRTLLLLIKEIFDTSNRLMESMLMIFSLLSDVDVSYKTIERLYRDEEVMLLLHNIFILLVRKKEITNVELSGDGTGYSITIKKIYSNVKDNHKERKEFVYFFALTDISTGLYVAYGYSYKSEKDAFDKAISVLKELGLRVSSVRLDRYYSFKSIVEYFDRDVKIYVIPKKNVSLRYSGNRFRSILKEFVTNPYEYLKEYYRRNYSESMFSSDKRYFGYYVRQRLWESIGTALLVRAVLHNLFWFYR